MKLLASFTFALQGIRVSFSGRNIRIHVVVGMLVIAASVYFNISRTEWALLLTCIGLVLSAELFNTAIEEICNALRAYHPDLYPKLGKPKDIAAGAVLMMAIFSAIVGLLILVPHML